MQYLNQRLYSSSIILNITFVIPEKEYLCHDPAYIFFRFDLFVAVIFFLFYFVIFYFIFQPLLLVSCLFSIFFLSPY